MLRLHWRRPAIRGKVQSRGFSVAHKSQRLSGRFGVSRGRSDAWVEAEFDALWPGSTKHQPRLSRSIASLAVREAAECTDCRLRYIPADRDRSLAWLCAL